MKKRIIDCLTLILVFLKIGAFSFGGGYAMIGIIQNEIVEKRKWIRQNDFFEIVVIAESTPGPISVNVATYVGYKVAGIIGSIFATLGLVLPSFLIIYIISLFYNEFISNEYVMKAFSGIKCGVIVLLLSTVFKLSSKIEKNAYFYIVFCLALIIMILFSIFLADFSWISLILIFIGLTFGVINTALASKKVKKV